MLGPDETNDAIITLHPQLQTIKGGKILSVLTEILEATERNPKLPLGQTK